MEAKEMNEQTTREEAKNRLMRKMIEEDKIEPTQAGMYADYYLKGFQTGFNTAIKEWEASQLQPKIDNEN